MLGLGINRNLSNYAQRWPQDAVFAVNFATGQAMRDNVMRPLHELVTFSRASSKFAPDSQGRWHLFAADVPAITDLGIHLEPAATNLVTSANGPIGWGPSRLTIAAGQPDPVGGLNACRLTLTGDPDPIVAQELDLGLLADRTFTHSIFARCEDAKGMSAGLGLLDYDAALADINIGAFEIGGMWQRYTFTFTFGSVADTQLLTRIDPFNPQGDMVVAAGAIDIWGWQVEEAERATSPINGASRAADDLKLSLPLTASILHFVFEDGTQHSMAVAGGAVDIPANLPTTITKAWAFA